MRIRTGIGYDVHRLKEGLKLILGGVEIPHTKGCVAHSDGDVLIHAICDALLGAAGLRDIGYYFPDTDDAYKNKESNFFLSEVCEMLKEKDYKISNVDSIIAMQSPKLKPYIEHMKESLALCMSLDIEDVSVKATTTENLGFEGRQEGVSAYATVLIYKD